MSINIEDNVARIRERMDRAAGGRPMTHRLCAGPSPRGWTPAGRTGCRR